MQGRDRARARTCASLAYRSHDIIRMTCIDDKLMQMKTLEKLACSAA